MVTASLPRVSLGLPVTWSKTVSVGLSAHVMALDILLAPTEALEFDLQTPPAWITLGNVLRYKSEAVTCAIHIVAKWATIKRKIIIAKTFMIYQTYS